MSVQVVSPGSCFDVDGNSRVRMAMVRSSQAA